ncbi:ABC transporter substrate-binding protein [Tomitella biformata]|uniref:ABC transporter substrate-binding protein n=1 Tax=Tomitella biformata TaxID=630403 RepID=UPI000465B695|nr:ABC transporter substrate-binding protein [Tomitella biformata]
MLSSRGRASIAAVVVLGSLVLASCASGGSDGATAGGGSDDATTMGLIGNQPDGGDPISGGKLTYASYSPIASLDPTVTMPSGATGASELSAVYDVLARWDPVDDTFKPQLAQEITPNEDFTSWTVTLRDGVNFSDGTPLNAEAVTWSIDRFVEKKGLNGQLISEGVASTTTPDEHTVVFDLHQPSATFPALLAAGPGIIVAPSSVQGDEFTPIGAGPFTVERFAPQDELVLAPKADYWGGKPYLDQLRFVNIAGDQAKIDAMDSGGIQMAYLRSPETVTAAREAGGVGMQEINSLGNFGMINNSEGRPGADIRVRKAMAYAIDPAQIDQRVANGTGLPGSEIFMPWSKWHTESTPITQDTAKAKELLDEAKADGYDGHLTYTSLSAPTAQAQALSVQAQLQAVGFNVEIVYLNNATDVTKRNYIERDFDISRGAASLMEQDPYIRLDSSLSSTSPSNALGFSDPAMDAALEELQTATTDDAKRAAIAKIQTVVNEEVPFLSWGAQATFITWQDDVHGVKPSLDTVILFDKAWIG